MASEVLQGTSNASWSNSTGQNVRVIVYYIQVDSSPGTLTIGDMGGISMPSYTIVGKYLGSHNDQGQYGQNQTNTGGYNTRYGVPLEFVLPTGKGFSTSGVSSYNLLIIPEGG